MVNTEFDDIRPYYDEEVPAAMARITQSEFFPVLASYVFPGQDIETVRNMFLSFKDIHDFQIGVMKHVNEQVIKRSISSFTYSGIENIEHSKRYLFVSNHRDIMLDAALLQYILWTNGHETSEITFGANLMTNPLVVDIGKSNKMFRVERGGSAKEFYRSSAHLSDYIRYVITQKHQSVWIAQRNGRTKDGNDTTDPGIVSMFSMSASGDKAKGLDNLNIVPVSVSYEWEPCDYEKATELYISRERKYVKQPGEDLQSILKGIVNPKGQVHFHINSPLTYEELLQASTEKGGARFNRSVAAILDSRIREGYRLFANNYIAYDLHKGTDSFSDKYTSREKSKFISHLEGLLSHFAQVTGTEPETETLMDICLGIYSNPVSNKHLQ